MASRHTFAWFVLLIGGAATIFYFIRNEDEVALSILFLTVYATATILYFLKMFYYIDNKATLNEVYFFSFANIIPLLVLLSGSYFTVGIEALLTFNIDILPSGDFTLSFPRYSTMLWITFKFIFITLFLSKTC